MTPRRALWILIVVSAVVRLGWAASLGMGNDEAYHYLFSVHRDWSYFDHPPMVAWVESIGPMLLGGRAEPFTLRLGFIALFAGSTWILARWTAREFGEWAGFFAAFGLNVAAYHTAAAGAFALPDGPLLFFWLLTLERMTAALRPDATWRSWLWVGLAWGGALLSKYHAVFLPMGLVVFLALEGKSRLIQVLRQPGPYLATGIGLLLFSPVIYWNATHGWASFAFQAGRAVGGVSFHPQALGAAILGQAAYLFPWVWATLWVVLIRSIGAWRRGETNPAERLMVSQAAVPLAVFTGVACFKEVLPHWTLVAYISAFPLLGRFWAEVWATATARRKRLIRLVGVCPLLCMGLMVLEYRTGFLQRGGVGTLGLVSPKLDPTVDLYGWDQVAAELDRRGLISEPGTFFFTSTWYQSGQLAFALRETDCPVVCYNPRDARSFSFWSRPEDFVGRDGILVSIGDRSTEPGMYDRFFSDIEPLGEFPIVRAGGAVRKVRLFRCVGQSVAFPYDGRPLPPRRIAGKGEATRRR